jgi:hypothetical protein
VPILRKKSLYVDYAVLFSQPATGENKLTIYVKGGIRFIYGVLDNHDAPEAERVDDTLKKLK